MKKAYVPDMLIDAVKNLDVRAQKLSDTQINLIIDDGYTELCSIIQAFSNEEIVSLQIFYDEGEEKVTLDVEEDVNEIYDLYLTIENQDKAEYDYGIKKIRDKRVIYKDNRYNGRVHLDFELLTEVVDNAVIKYYYTPTSSTETVYMDAQTWLALKSALGVALYDTLHDVERNGQKRAEATRRARAILPELPEDATDPSFGHIFNGLLH